MVFKAHCDLQFSTMVIIPRKQRNKTQFLIMFKGTVHPKMKMLSSFTPSNGSGAPLDPTVEVNGAPKLPDYKLSSKHIPMFTAEQTHSYRFGKYLRLSRWQHFHFWVNCLFKSYSRTWFMFLLHWKLSASYRNLPSNTIKTSLVTTKNLSLFNTTAALTQSAW